MANPPAINFTIPFVAQAFHVIVNANGVQPDGTNVPTPDTTSALVFTNIAGPTGYTVAVDPANNRRVIVTPNSGLPPGGAAVSWQFRITVAGKLNNVIVSGQTPAAADLSGVVWDNVAPGPA